MQSRNYRFLAETLFLTVIILTFLLGKYWKDLTAWTAKMLPGFLPYLWVSEVALLAVWFAGFFFLIRAGLSRKE